MTQVVRAPRVKECPVQMEGMVHHYRPFGKNVNANVFEVHIEKLHVAEELRSTGSGRPHVDADRWRPLMMSFCRFYGLGGEGRGVYRANVRHGASPVLEGRRFTLGAIFHNAE